MNTKWNFLIAIVLLALLVGMNTSPVKAEGGLVISPDVLPKGIYAAKYVQPLTVSGGSGTYTYYWLSGDLPQGVLLYPSGEVSGYPQVTGTFIFTVQVQDSNDASLTGTKEYTLVVEKEPLQVMVWTDPVEITAYGQGFDIYAATNPFIQGVGTFAFYLDDAQTPIAGCEAVPLVNYGAYCAGSAEMPSGEHTITVVLTLVDPWTGLVEQPTNGTVTHTVGYRISGTLFEDVDEDGVFDASEPLTGAGWFIELDQDCDGSIEQAVESDANGYYEFTKLAGGSCYRLSAAEQYGWRQPQPLADIASLTGDIADVNIGQYPVFYAVPLDPPLGDVGVAYSHQYSISGPGVEPFTYGMIDVEPGQPSILPAGLTLSADGLLSGTPTEGGVFNIRVVATDGNGAVSTSYSEPLVVSLDGSFTLTSSHNPSMPDETVTFSLAATGALAHPEYGAIPPLGYVAFLADGTPIEGCTQVMLNVVFDESGNPLGFGDAPATCTTAALAIGTHAITAAFTDFGSHWYHEAIVTLEGGQTVTPASSADLRLTKVENKDPVKRGTALVYTLTVTNLGPNPADGLTLVDTLDPKTTFVDVSVPRGWLCEQASGVVTCTGTRLASGSRATIKVIVMVSKTAVIGSQLVNSATVSGTTYDPVMTNNSVVQKTRVAK